MTDNLNADEVIIIDSHDDIFKGYRIHYWSKERISDILPAIKCPSFKSEIKIFKTSETYEIWRFINDQKHKKSIVIENMDGEVSINLIYGDTVKITPYCLSPFELTIFLEELPERYELCEIADCTCKPKKIRVWERGLENLIYAIEELERISNINDAKLGMYIDSKNYERSFSKYDTMVFNHWSSWMSNKTSKLIFTGDTFAVVSNGKYYNFRLDQRTKESKDSYIRGKI